MTAPASRSRDTSVASRLGRPIRRGRTRQARQPAGLNVVLDQNWYYREVGQGVHRRDVRRREHLPGHALSLVKSGDRVDRGVTLHGIYLLHSFDQRVDEVERGDSSGGEAQQHVVNAEVTPVSLKSG